MSWLKSRIRWIRHFCCCAGQRIVGGVEVGDQDARESLQVLVEECPLAGWLVEVDHLLEVREDPDVGLADPL